MDDISKFKGGSQSARCSHAILLLRPFALFLFLPYKFLFPLSRKASVKPQNRQSIEIASLKPLIIRSYHKHTTTISSTELSWQWHQSAPSQSPSPPTTSPSSSKSYLIPAFPTNPKTQAGVKAHLFITSNALPTTGSALSTGAKLRRI